MKKAKALKLGAAIAFLASLVIDKFSEAIDDEIRREETRDIVKEELARQIINVENDIDEDKES